MVTAYRGASLITTRQTNEVEESYRRMVLELDPNGECPITGLLSTMPSETTDSVTHHWWERAYSPREGAAAVYIDSDLATTYVYATHQTAYGISGATVYVKVAEALAKEFRANHTCRLLDASDPTVSVGGTVKDVQVNGASSRITVKLNEADDNAATPSATASLQTADRIEITGSAHSEYGERSTATNYLATERTNYCQNFRETLIMSYRDMVQKVRTGEGYQKLRASKLKAIMRDIEWTAVHGVPAGLTNLDDAGHAHTRMGGLMYWIKTYASTVANSVVAYNTDTDYSGALFRTSGMDWMNKILSQLGVYGSRKRYGYCGRLVNLAVNDLGQVYHDIHVEPGTNSFGQIINKWFISGLELEMTQHPLFNLSQDMQRTMLIIDKANVRQVKLKGGDVQYHTDPNTKKVLRAMQGKTASELGISGIEEEWYADLSLEIHHPDTHMIATGFGMPNTV